MNNEWQEYRRLVISELKRLGEADTDLDDRLTELEKQVLVQKTTQNVISGIIAFVVTAILAALQVLFK